MHRLARDLGRTVAELMVSMSWAEMVNWMAFFRWENEQQKPPGQRTMVCRDAESDRAAIRAILPVIKKRTRK
jgi:hypothetical protein